MMLLVGNVGTEMESYVYLMLVDCFLISPAVVAAKFTAIVSAIKHPI